MAEATSPLLELPPELRNRIYDLVLHRYADIIYVRSPWPRDLPSLLHVNRLMRADTLPMYYSRTLSDFGQIGTEEQDAQSVERWLSSLDTRAIASLRQVRVRRCWTFSTLGDAPVVISRNGDADWSPRVMRSDLLRTTDTHAIEREEKHLESVVFKEIGRLQRRSGGSLNIEDWTHLIAIFGNLRDDDEVTESMKMTFDTPWSANWRKKLA